MAKYRVVRKHGALYEGLVQRRIFGIWWTISRWWDVFGAEQELDRIHYRKTNGPFVTKEMEI